MQQAGCADLQVFGSEDLIQRQFVCMFHMAAETNLCVAFRIANAHF